MSEVSVHRWPPRALTGDLLRGGVAFAVVLALPLAMRVGWFGFFGLLALIALFGLYLASTVSRLTSVIEVCEEGVRLRGGLFGARTIKWVELSRLELRHFPLSRDRKKGWMDLKLKGGGATITVDDRIGGFPELLARAWEAARAADVGVSDTTHANLIAMGLVAKPRR